MSKAALRWRISFSRTSAQQRDFLAILFLGWHRESVAQDVTVYRVADLRFTPIVTMSTC